MNQNFKAMLQLLSYGVFDILPPIDSFYVGEVLRMARFHGVSLCVLSALLKIEGEGNCLIDTAASDSQKASFYIQCVNHRDHRDRTQKFLHDLLSGISYAVIKGDAMASLYPYPEYREAGDTDIIIPLADEEKVLTKLHDYGFHVFYRSASSNHSSCYHKDYGVIEVHVSLFCGMLQNDWFDGCSVVTEPFRTVDGIPVLGINDGFLFLFLHAVKHFICHVLTAKLLTDLLLYIRAYREQMDFELIDDVLGKLGYRKFLDCVLTIGVTILGLPAQSLVPFTPYEEVDTVLDDMEKGGFFGFGEPEHGNMFENYHILKLKNKMGDRAGAYMTRTRRRDALKTAAFSKKNMHLRYFYTQKYPWLLPIACIQHLLYILFAAVMRPHLLRSVVSFGCRITDKSEKQLIDKRIKIINEMRMI